MCYTNSITLEQLFYKSFDGGFDKGAAKDLKVGLVDKAKCRRTRQ